MANPQSDPHRDAWQTPATRSLHTRWPRRTEEIDRLYFGSLLASGPVYAHGNSGPWTLDVLANDRLTETGEHATIISVTQPSAG